MIYTNRHPAGAHPNHDGTTVERMRLRLILLGASGQIDEVTRISNAVYRELAAGIEAGRIEPRKRVYLDDRPAEMDFTLCVIGVDPVLDVARRRQDGGRKIAELLEAHAGGIDSVSIPAESPSKARPGPIPTADRIETAARELLAAGHVPAQTITWEQFRTELCKKLNVKPEQRGYSLDTIQAAVRPLLSAAQVTEGTESTEN
jgi:hypothetical protein